jgi:hypothetical protein
MTSIDTNVSNYTLAELMAIVGLNDLEPSEITEKTNKQITRFKSKNPELSVFFQAIQSELLQYVDGLKNEDEDEDDTSKKIVVEGFGNMKQFIP